MKSQILTRHMQMPSGKRTFVSTVSKAMRVFALRELETRRELSHKRCVSIQGSLSRATLCDGEYCALLLCSAQAPLAIFFSLPFPRKLFMNACIYNPRLCIFHL